MNFLCSMLESGKSFGRTVKQGKGYGLSYDEDGGVHLNRHLKRE